MISYHGLLLHNKHKCKDVLVTSQGLCKLAENIIEGKEMKNHKQLIRIFFSLILFPRSSCYCAILILVKYFIRKQRLVNPTDSTYPECTPELCRLVKRLKNCAFPLSYIIFQEGNILCKINCFQKNNLQTNTNQFTFKKVMGTILKCCNFGKRILKQ